MTPGNYPARALCLALLLVLACACPVMPGPQTSPQTIPYVCGDCAHTFRACPALLDHNSACPACSSVYIYSPDYDLAAYLRQWEADHGAR